MAQRRSDLDQAKRGAVLLAATIVQTVNEAEPTFRERFETNLQTVYNVLLSLGSEDDLGTLEMIRWMGEVLSKGESA